jgi:regulator of protease activity HflC (stomatin/prohibitin superfamily)
MTTDRVSTPPLSTPAAPRMARDDDELVVDDAYLGLQQSLLRPEEKTSALRGVFGRVFSDGHSVGYGPDVHEPFPPQAYKNTLEADEQCVWCTGPLPTFLCLLGSPFCCAPLCSSCVTVYPRQAVVTTVYGRFFHAFTAPGLYFINPCGRDAQVVTLKTTSVELASVKVADKNGNPLVMSGVVSYAVVDPTRAALDVLNVPAFVKTNAHAALKRVASLFPYETPPVGIPGGIGRGEFDDSRGDPLDSNARVSTRVPQTPGSASSVKPPRDSADDAARSVSLKTESHLLGGHLREMLQARMEVCGIKIVSFELSDLAYAAEVAPMMLARQQAAALVDARATIVDGAVNIVDRATRRLAELGHAASAGDRARLATNMMTVLAGETRPQPTISLSEAEFLPASEG